MKSMIGFQEALGLSLSRAPSTGAERLPVDRLAGRVLAEDLLARVDSPSADVSLKDGYAVVSGDLSGAGEANALRLAVLGSVQAGGAAEIRVQSGRALRITTGAPIPEGADAVLAEEYCRREGDSIACFAPCEPGRNVLARGADIAAGEPLASAGELLSPPRVGLLAAAGLDSAPVGRRPRVGVVAIGDEVVAPGHPLPSGKLYASNQVEIGAWLAERGIACRTAIVPDREGEIGEALRELLPDIDALLTAGGAWSSERDLAVRVLEALGWEGIYHRVRMGPGKGVGFGLLEGKPVFCLPGGPPSCEMAFLQLALPALMAMQGQRAPGLPRLPARLAEAVEAQADWTEFFGARLERRADGLWARPARRASRLQSMSMRDALIVLPEGVRALPDGAQIEVQVLRF
ncbi:MAG: molybdopterin molybdotransferase MoeA [Deltaproteobacteria bacterium]|nr:molybdopterin molybdotransferase MoeA [Deltaproteobacteria bacterium]